VLVRCWLSGRTLYVDREVYKIGCEIDRIPALFDTLEHGQAREWQIIADSARPETIAYLRRHGFPRMEAARKGAGSIEEGVAFLQSYNILVDPACQHTIDELTLYSYKTDRLTGEVVPVLEDRSNHCIAEGALVTCERGDVPIEDVRIGDRVLTRDGYRRVTFAGQTDADRAVVEVVTASGKRLHCTPDHEIFTAQGWKRADTLRYTDDVLEVASWSSAWSGMGASIAGILRARGGQIASTSFGQFPAELGRFIGTSGSTRTGLRPRAFTFTTETAIPAITPSATWSASPRATIASTIRSSVMRWSDSARTWTLFARLRKRGTPQTPVGRGIVRTASGPTPPLSPFRSPARSAVGSSRPTPSATVTASAPTPASRHGGGRLASMTWTERAWSAVVSFVSAAMRGRRVVRGHVATVCAAKPCARVYDLTVEGQHEFFANGILVSNCIDSLRYASERIRRPHEPLALLFEQPEVSGQAAVEQAILSDGVYWPGG
jgi:hypothetical protein